MAARKALLLVTMEPPAGMEDEFNDWYDTEHFPQRCGLPGFESGARFVCLDGWPRWLALYDLTSRAALATPAYLAVSGGNATPWSRRIMSRTIGRTRVVAERIAPGHANLGEVDRVSRLLVASYPNVPPDDALTVSRAMDGRLAEVPGLLRHRLFQAAPDGARGLWLVAEFAHPVGAKDARRAVAEIDGHAAHVLNLYAPYRRG